MERHVNLGQFYLKVDQKCPVQDTAIIYCKQTDSGWDGGKLSGPRLDSTSTDFDSPLQALEATGAGTMALSLAWASGTWQTGQSELPSSDIMELD